MKKSNIIAIIIVIAIILIGVAIGISNNNKSGTESTDSSSQGQSAAVEAESKYEVPEDAQTFFDDYINLQNEASRKVDTGELAQEKYFDLLEKGIQITQMKETYEADGMSDELTKQIAEIKPYLYDIANEMGSDLAAKFETK